MKVLSLFSLLGVSVFGFSGIANAEGYEQLPTEIHCQAVKEGEAIPADLCQMWIINAGGNSAN